MAYDADAIIVGAGLAGLVAAAELIDAGKRIIILDQEPEQSLGGQAFWSLGGIFLVDSPEQRRMGIRDSHALALQDWMGTAAFDRDEDYWPRRWAEAYVAFAAGEKRAWLHERGFRFFPGRRLGGARRRTTPSATAIRCRAFISPGEPGPACSRPSLLRVREGREAGARHASSSGIESTNSRESGAAVDGVRGDILEPSDVERGRKSSREVVGAFEFKAQAVIVTSGGIGANHELVRAELAAAFGPAPRRMISGVPDHVDGRMLAITRSRRRHASSTATACGTMWRASRTGIRSGPTTPSAFCRDRRRSGSMRAASGCRCRSIPASTRSARSSTSWRPATTIPGSC